MCQRCSVESTLLVLLLLIWSPGCSSDAAPGLDGGTQEPEVGIPDIMVPPDQGKDVGDMQAGPLPACSSAPGRGTPCDATTLKPCYVKGAYCGDNGFNDQFRKCSCTAGKVACPELMPSDGSPCEIPAGMGCTTGELYKGTDACTCLASGTWSCVYTPPPDAG